MDPPGRICLNRHSFRSCEAKTALQFYSAAEASTSGPVWWLAIHTSRTVLLLWVNFPRTNWLRAYEGATCCFSRSSMESALGAQVRWLVWRMAFHSFQILESSVSRCGPPWAALALQERQTRQNCHLKPRRYYRRILPSVQKWAGQSENAFVSRLLWPGEHDKLPSSDRGLEGLCVKETPRRLRIAYVVHDYNRSFGHSRYVAELATRFKRDHEVHVFANTVHEPDPKGLTFHHVPASRLNVMTTLLSFVLPATWMTTGQYDIIHAQGVCGLRQNVVTAHIWRQGCLARCAWPSMQAGRVVAQ